MQTSRLLRITRLLVAAALWVAASASARACMEYELNSVHFNGGGPDLGLLPRRASISYRGEHDSRPIPASESTPGEYHGMELDESRDQERHQNRRVAISQTLTAASASAGRGDLVSALGLLRRLALRWGWDGNLHSAAELLEEASRAAPVGAAPATTLCSTAARYLDGIRLYEAEDYTGSLALFAALGSDLQSAPGADTLRAHVLYQQASLAYEWLDFPRAVGLYRQLLQQYPGGPCRESALIMLARAAVLPATDEGRRLPDGEWALATLRKEFPHSRFRNAAAGLQARIDTLEERYKPALAAYMALRDIDSVDEVCRALDGATLHKARADLLALCLRLLTETDDYREYERALTEIDRVKRAFGSAEVALFHAQLERDSATAAAYLYYRLNHTHVSPGEVARLESLGARIAGRPDAAALPPLLLVELAEIAYRRGRYDRAAALAIRCLQAHPNNDRALYVLGAARHRQSRLHEALSEYEKLLSACPRSGIRQSAREEAALTAEALGDYSTALRHYFALEYYLDAAYLLDVRMPIREMERYLQSDDARGPFTLMTSPEDAITPHPIVLRRRDLVVYSLGIRYMRREQWDLAEAKFRSLPQSLYRRLSVGRTGSPGDWESHPSPDPLTAVRSLRALELAARTARGAARRAEALFRYGSYYHSHGTLLLYNPALWDRRRELSFGYWQNRPSFLAKDLKVVRAYMYEHEVYARSWRTCLSVYTRYPHAPIAPQALYRAACAARALASFNEWWRDDNKKENHWAECTRLMNTFARRYPHHPLAAEARKYARVFNQERLGNW